MFGLGESLPVVDWNLANLGSSEGRPGKEICQIYQNTWQELSIRASTTRYHHRHIQSS
jgi:hypothetical protein